MAEFAPGGQHPPPPPGIEGWAAGDAENFAPRLPVQPVFSGCVTYPQFGQRKILQFCFQGVGEATIVLFRTRRQFGLQVFVEPERRQFLNVESHPDLPQTAQLRAGELPRRESVREVFVSLNPFEDALQHDDFRDFLLGTGLKNLFGSAFRRILAHCPLPAPFCVSSFFCVRFTTGIGASACLLG
jgi:hypothetical protein